MAADQSGSYGLSVMGWLHAWFHIEGIKNMVMLAAVILFVLPLVRVKLYRNTIFQLLFLANMLLWVIIFNHKAESPTYIIAFAGACIWYFTSARLTGHKVMFALVFIFTCLSVTDLFPHSIKNSLFTPYVIKAVPCIFLWIFIELQLLFMPLNTQGNKQLAN